MGKVDLKADDCNIIRKQATEKVCARCNGTLKKERRAEWRLDGVFQTERKGDGIPVRWKSMELWA